MLVVLVVAWNAVDNECDGIGSDKKAQKETSDRTMLPVTGTVQQADRQSPELLSDRTMLPVVGSVQQGDRQSPALLSDSSLLESECKDVCRICSHVLEMFTDLKLCNNLNC